MLKVQGRATSSNVQKVMWAIGELGLAFERTDIGGPFGGNREESYLAKNPNGLIPTVDHDGLVLWESNTIVRYLACVYGAGTLWPTDPKIRAAAEKWTDWQLSVANSGMVGVFRNMIRTKPENRNMEEVDSGRKKMVECFRILDNVLASQQFLGGERLTIADIPMGVICWRYHELPIDRPPLPNVSAWYERLKERPSYRSHVMIPLC
jgi:glutathione S-transferase